MNLSQHDTPSKPPSRLELSPRELDAWLAEHLFGWEMEGKPQGNRRLISPEGAIGVYYERKGGKVHYMGGYRNRWTLPLYSSSYERMGLVLEAMRARGWQVDIHGRHDAFHDGWWRAEFVGPFTGKTAHRDMSLPMAVALAAKAARESETATLS